MAETKRLVGFNERDARRIAEAVRSVERGPRPAERSARTPGAIYRPTFWRISGVAAAGAGGEYTVRKQTIDPTARTLADITDYHDPDYELDRPGWTPGVGCQSWRSGLIYPGSIMLLGEQWGVLLDVPSVFAVALTQTGGAQGTDAAAASWTYTVADYLASTELATAVDPTASPHLWRRPTVGWIVAATHGLATANAAGNLVLTWINEIAEQEACE